MANLQSSNHSSSSSNYYRKSPSGSPSRRPNTQATAYAVDATTMALTGFHFTHGLARGTTFVLTIYRGGGFEVPLGVPSPPPSPETAPMGRSPARRPSLQPQHRKRSGDAACHITEECERLFCETLKAVFLVEKTTALENSLSMDMRGDYVSATSSSSTTTTTSATARPIPQPPQQLPSALLRHGQITPSPSPDGRVYPEPGGLMRDYVEVWDYVGGVGFKGFVAENDAGRTLFVFFGKEVVGMDLKPGLMSLLELATLDRFDCSKLVIGIDRETGNEAVKDLSHDLGWAGFELAMLDEWAGEENCVSDRWLFLEVDT